MTGRARASRGAGIDADVIAAAALDLVDETGLDGLTMRRLADRLGVQVSALYWHVRNKQQVLDLMATSMTTDATTTLEAPRRTESWEDWLVRCVTGLRRALLRHRDGARVFAGNTIVEPAAHRFVELVLRAMQDEGFEPRTAARSFPVLLHFAVGFTIEEQARAELAGSPDDPYTPEHLAGSIDAERFPLAHATVVDLFDPDTDAGFEHGLRIILAGIRAVEGPAAAP